MDNRQRPLMTRPEGKPQEEKKKKKQKLYPNRPWLIDPLVIFMPGVFPWQKKDEDERKYHLYLKNIEFHNIDLVLLIIVVMLCALGLLMMFSASYAWAINATKDNNGEYYVVRQAIFVGVGFLIILFLSSKFFDYHMLRSMAVTYTILIGSMGLVAMVLVKGIGDDANGAQRWLQLGGFRFQPSEMLKLALIIFLSRLLSKYSECLGKGSEHSKEILVIIGWLIVVGTCAVLMYKEPHLSGMIIICIIGVFMLFISEVRLSKFLPICAAGIFGGAAMVMHKYNEGGYVADRINGWMYTWDPENRDIAWQTRNSLIAIGSGGWWGLGLGNSRQKFLYLPESHNDFVFSIVCEELGLMTGIAVIVAFVCFAIKGFAIAWNAPDRYGMLMAAGITGHLIVQVILNIAVVSNGMPNTGISLPFFSYGGSAVLIQLTEVGLLFNISKQRYVRPDQKSRS
ncbi:MAG: FtsW/RodA/SpoVE family cell cycle protein [Oscillospiraceae bacterium]|nr:FtsW/RodA/SpoVE family cell cycle protein [Oscillospiraceae bacterium]